MVTKFEHEFSSEMGKAQDTLLRIISFLTENDVVDTAYILDDLKLVFSELLFNAAIHGNGLDADKKVYVCVEFIEDELVSVIRDEGQGFDFQNQFETLDIDLNLGGEHGRGMKLVQAMTDYFSFNEQGNEVIFRKRLVAK